MEKRCYRCEETKDTKFFHKNKSKRDGFSTWCKTCRREYGQRSEVKEACAIRMQKYQRKYQQHLREYQRKYQLRPEVKVAHAKAGRKYKEKFPEKIAAGNTINNAIKANHVTKPTTCSVNNKDCRGQIEGHHPDYSTPLDVIWLCQYHHRELHHKAARVRR